MELQDIADALLKDSRITPIRGLNAIAEAERYLQQAYEGRYFFELIQNVRDANKEKGEDGEIFVAIKNNTLYISNTGAEFSPKGIESITTIGRSTKRSQDFIGFKGIGFKSIQEVCDYSKIVTRHGSILFDKRITLEYYEGRGLREDDVPTFYFPYYSEEKLTEDEVKQGIVTRIELPFKKSVNSEKIISDFSEVRAKQLILLGNIKLLSFESDNLKTNFLIHKNHQKRFIEVKEGIKHEKFRYFTPANKIVIPEEVVNSLEGKEREIFSTGSHVDITIVLELAENGQFNIMEAAKLYLFYPLQITSGFRFLIHSYFIVNPERTSLRNSAMNNFLLTSIGEFIGKDILRSLKESKANTNKILCFTRNQDAKISVLYDALVAELKKQRFIYDSRSQKYFDVTEVIVADGFDKGLFPGGKLGEKQLVYTDDDAVIEWLQREFKVAYLSYDDIADQIEHECKRQLKQKNVGFFQNLYKYVSSHNMLDLTGKKVLLTDNWRLASSEEDVFYGGGRSQISLSASIKRHIHFIHKGIKISDFREGRSRTGITEFNTNELVRRLLKMFNIPSVPKGDVLNALFGLTQLDAKSELEIREKILLPIKGSYKWVSPITTPIYFETENLKSLYPNGQFIDEAALVSNENSQLVKEFLTKFGVWDIPAIYLSSSPVKVVITERRNKHIANYSSLASRPYYVKNDRLLDKPAKYNSWFTTTVIDNWPRYYSYITSRLHPPLQYYNSQTTYSRIATDNFAVQICGVIEILSTERWITFSGEDSCYSIDDIIGIKQFDFSQSHNHVLSRYLKLLPVNYDARKDLIAFIGLVHLDGDSVDNFTTLLKRIYNIYSKEIPTNKDFLEFYNRILSKLVDFFYNNNQTDIISQLKNVPFLAINEVTQSVLWSIASNTFYLDDKINYDLLPASIKAKLQPHFTNRDKNTFGRIAAKIGKRFSHSIEKTIVSSPIISSSTLISYFKYLPESIALLESKLELTLNHTIKTVIGVQVYEKEGVQVRMQVTGVDDTIVNVSHFVDEEDGFSFHLANEKNQNKQLADSMSDLYVNILERDLRMYSADLLRFLNTEDKKSYLLDYDIQEARISEIRDKLHSSELTSVQKFWEIVLSLKQISLPSGIFKNKIIDTSILSSCVKIPESELLLFNEKFRFEKPNDSNNIPFLDNMLTLLDLTLGQVNGKFYPKFDFREFFLKSVLIEKNKFEIGFEAITHRWLSSQSLSERMKYQDYIDSYKRGINWVIPQDTLKIDPKKLFIEGVSLEFEFLKTETVDSEKDYTYFRPVEIYISNITGFKIALANMNLAATHLDIFLADNERRSLLYFNEINHLCMLFSAWVEEYDRRNKPIEKENELETFLGEFSNQTEEEIEIVTTGAVDVPRSSNGSSGGKGRRYDGSLGEEYKNRIGLVAEMLVYERLRKSYDKVKWVSKLATKIQKIHVGYNPEGQDGLGYDIEYINSEGEKIYVEVKGRADSENSFEITRTELERAYKERDRFKIIIVNHTLNNSVRKIRDLGNLFLLTDGEDFFSNKKFKALYRNFEIRFQERS